MRIFDCIQFFNEENILDLRLNILNEFVDFFVVVESTTDHQGREKKLRALSLLDTTIILYESPKRIKRTLEDILNIFGERPTVICKELTKIHEKKIRGNLSQVIFDINNAKTKGEFVILIGKNDPNVYF